ncbi:MAG: hypothetical protein Q4D07_07940 [Selenomonadaceae bacterium]|nr:hypothetical protein [Selenomonadaceae bacterium]
MNDISNAAAELANIDRAILDALQRGLPVTERPFAMIAQELGVYERVVVTKTAALKRAGYIRRLGAFFSSRCLGYRGTLVALSVEEEKLAAIAEFVNGFTGVTHNYQREGKYQLWFTLLTMDDAEKQSVLSAVEKTDGVNAIIELPSEKTYKIRVTLPMNEAKPLPIPQESGQPEQNDSDAMKELDYLDRQLIHLMSDELPVVDNPYDILAKKLNIPVGEVLNRINKYLSLGVMRRLGIVLAHRRAGYTANGLCAWQASPEQVDEIGATIAAEELRVSHCYRRQADETKGWPYTLYTMIHGHSREEVERIAASMAERYSGLGDRVMLYSVREWKKASMTYFG